LDEPREGRRHLRQSHSAGAGVVPATEPLAPDIQDDGPLASGFRLDGFHLLGLVASGARLVDAGALRAVLIVCIVAVTSDSGAVGAGIVPALNPFPPDIENDRPITPVALDRFHLLGLVASGARLADAGAPGLVLIILAICGFAAVRRGEQEDQDHEHKFLFHRHPLLCGFRKRGQSELFKAARSALAQSFPALSSRVESIG
jgi:hypothetical protein